jgi:hypothetical protein
MEAMNTLAREARKRGRKRFPAMRLVSLEPAFGFCFGVFGKARSPAFRRTRLLQNYQNVAEKKRGQGHRYSISQRQSRPL